MEEKKAKWIYFMEDRGKPYFVCSACRHISTRKLKECDGCGAKMEETKKEENHARGCF